MTGFGPRAASVSRVTQCYTPSMPGKRVYRRRAGGSCSRCKHRRAMVSQRQCARCHRLYQQFQRLKKKPMRSLDEDIALVTLGLRLVRLSFGFREGVA